MSIVEKKVWTGYFRDIKADQKHFEVRLADFKINSGDTLVLNEWDNRKREYTGRKLEFKVGSVLRIPQNMKKFYTAKQMKKGFYVIELKKR
jgi:ASC-1-like (ASCH) protein